MRVLLLYGQCYRDIRSLAEAHYAQVLDHRDYKVEMEKVHLHTIDSAREIFLTALKTGPHDIVHIYYDDM